MVAVDHRTAMAAAFSPPLPLRPRSLPLLLAESSFSVAAGNPRSIRARTLLAITASAHVVPSSSEVVELESSAEVVRRFYGGINCQDLTSVEILIGDQCVYEDLIFPHPFVGRKAIMEFFSKFIDITGTDLQFVIDDISEEDSSAVGVTWHLEWKGKTFPFSKGCSFYRLQVIDGKRQITYGRDSVEPAIKPGETALVCFGTPSPLSLTKVLSLSCAELFAWIAPPERKHWIWFDKGGSMDAATISSAGRIAVMTDRNGDEHNDDDLI